MIFQCDNSKRCLLHSLTNQCTINPLILGGMMLIGEMVNNKGKYEIDDAIDAAYRRSIEDGKITQVRILIL